ncbi:MAG: hypothetical protein KR126chlam1_00748 [Chlamydiae bacterium]|nr:hypothetical protein [Chlamydiota bacterium]
MTWEHLEKIFNRSFHHSLSKQKWFLVFPVIALCSFLGVICRTIAKASTPWIQMSLAFLPIFLCAGFLLAVGIVLVRIYHHELKGERLYYLKTIRNSGKLFWGISYLAVPLIFAYLILWMILGVFYLLRAIPAIGEFVGAILSFGPFLLVLGSLVLSILSLLILFYITPAAARKSELRPSIAEEVYGVVKTNPFQAVILPLFGLLPLFLVGGLLALAAFVTRTMYAAVDSSLFFALRWFLIMLPFSALLTPAVVFFFNFSAESYNFIHKKTEKK